MSKKKTPAPQPKPQPMLCTLQSSAKSQILRAIAAQGAVVARICGEEEVEYERLATIQLEISGELRRMQDLIAAYGIRYWREVE